MARAAVYSLLSLGVQNIFVCNRTLTHATALADHYNNLVMDGKLSGLILGDASQTHVRVLDTFASPWPNGVRYPTIIVNCIPRLGPDDSATSISLPEHWLKSPTGGVVVEVSESSTTRALHSINKSIGSVPVTSVSTDKTDQRTSIHRLDSDGRVRRASRASVLAIRTLYWPKSSKEAYERRDPQALSA